MKKILALLLVICCMLSVVSCDMLKKDDGDNDNSNANTSNDSLARFSKMLAESVPTASDIVVTHDINESVIENTFSLQFIPPQLLLSVRLTTEFFSFTR